MDMDKYMVDCVDRKELLAVLEDSNVPVKGIRLGLGKIIFTEYSQKLKDGYADIIRKMPAANVVFEAHGKWLEVGKTERGTPIRLCSHCGVEKAGRPKSNYCPDCGCCMDIGNTSSAMIDGQQTFI